AHKFSNQWVHLLAMGGDFLPGLVGAIACGGLAAVAYFISQLLLPRGTCPNCGTKYPRLYWPRNWRQGWRGGKTCKKCGCETDHLGRVLSCEGVGKRIYRAMLSERDKMLAGELYDPLDPELVRARGRARDLCQDLNATRERDQEARRRILTELFGRGGETVWMQPPFFCDYGTNILLDRKSTRLNS